VFYLVNRQPKKTLYHGKEKVGMENAKGVEGGGGIKIKSSGSLSLSFGLPLFSTMLSLLHPVSSPYDRHISTNLDSMDEQAG